MRYVIRYHSKFSPASQYATVRIPENQKQAPTAIVQEVMGPDYIVDEIAPEFIPCRA